MPVSFMMAVADPISAGRPSAMIRRVVARRPQSTGATGATGATGPVVVAGSAAVWVSGPRAGVHHSDGVASAWVHPRDGIVCVDGRRPRRAGACVVAADGGLELRRGPFGGRPLYYAKADDGAIMACTQTGPLLRETAPRELDRDVLAARILSRAPIDSSATAYRHIRRVRPCETLRFRAGGVTSSVSLPTRLASRQGPPDALAAAWLEALVDVVQRSIDGADRVAVLASGGVDSSSLLALLVKRSHVPPHRLLALAYDFAGPGDDRPHLAALERSLGIQAVRFPPAQASSRVHRSFSVDGVPYPWTTGALGLEACARVRAFGADVLMTGVVGDLVLDGDYGRFAERVARGDLRAILEAAKMVDTVRSTPLQRVMRLVMKPLIRRRLPAGLLRRRRSRATRRSPAWIWGGDHLRRVLAQAPMPAGPEDGFEELATSAEVADEADARGQAELEAGCDIIDPYLDEDFLRFVASLPADALFHGHRSRGLFRHAMRGLLPEGLRLRSDKASFEPAIDQVVRALGGPAGFGSLLTMEATADLGLIAPAAFREAFEAQASGTPSACGWIDLWPALAIEAFVRGAGVAGSGADELATPW